MDLEFLLRKKPGVAEIAQGILFQDGDITENAEAPRRTPRSTTRARQRPAADARLARHRQPGGGHENHLLRSHAPICDAAGS